MPKTTSKITTYEITFHDLRDELGIHTKRIVSVTIVEGTYELDKPALRLTVEEVISEE